MMRKNSFRFVMFIILLFILLSYANFRPKCITHDLKTDFVRVKESLAERLVFGDYDKTLWNINLSDKRMAEFGKFGACGDVKRKTGAYDEAKRRSNLAEQFFELAKKGGEDMTYLNERMEKNLVLTEGVK